MNQSDLRERLSALQNALMTLYENDPTDLKSQIEHYMLQRKEAVLQYYARKEGYKSLGLQPLPSLVVSEHNAKESIRMMLYLKSLEKSMYAKETWTLTDTSRELFNTPPKNCFKKGGYEVTVWFDNDPDNAFPYPNWSYIYYQSEDDVWHKTAGLVDENGLYYEDIKNERVYFVLFEEKAQLYSKTGHWTVNFKNQQLSSSVISSTRRQPSPLPIETEGHSNGAGPSSSYTTRNAFSNSSQNTDRRRKTPDKETSPSSTTRTPERRRRRGDQQQGESAPKRKRGGGAAGAGSRQSYSPTAGEVGTSRRLVTETGLSRLARLQKEARDPPVLIVKGPANTLKCFRYRCYTKVHKPFTQISTVWHWVCNDQQMASGRILVAFDTVKQRELFLDTITIPKGSSYDFGTLNSL